MHFLRHSNLRQRFLLEKFGTTKFLRQLWFLLLATQENIISRFISPYTNTKNNLRHYVEIFLIHFLRHPAESRFSLRATYKKIISNYASTYTNMKNITGARDFYLGNTVPLKRHHPRKLISRFISSYTNTENNRRHYVE